jgi:membrane carboxypeptidase/penicillin-binding protein
MLIGVVLSVKPNEVRVARSSTDIITIKDKKALSVIARALNPKAPNDLRLQRGSVVYLHKAVDYWEILNLPTVQSAFISMIPQDGAIRAMVGGFDFYHGNFNRVTQAWRQPGSAFKPFIYAASLERGLTPATVISDQPFELTAEQTGSKAWAPKNYGGQYDDKLTMREAIARSKNMVSIRILQSIGPKYAQDYITRFGFDKSRHPAYLPMALGSGAVTPMQLAAGFSVFANGGYRITPFLIDRVTDANGQAVVSAKTLQPPQNVTAAAPSYEVATVEKVGLQRFLRMLLYSGLSHYTYNECAFLALDSIHPVTHAVANTIKRVAVIVLSVLYFRNPLTLTGALGSAIAIVGVMLYSIAKATDKPPPTTLATAAKGRPSSRSEPKKRV